MTARQTRRERRASERKAKKLARKAAQHPAIDAIAPSSGDTPAEFRFSPESEDEFSPEFLTHAASLHEHFAAPESPRAAKPRSPDLRPTVPMPNIPPARVHPPGNWLRLVIR
jgi:hypothetical protein